MKSLKEVIDKYKGKELSDKKKIENKVYILIMLVIIVIGINQIWFSDDENKDSNNVTNIQQNKNEEDSNIQDIDTNDNLETKLKNILEKVNGIKNVSVLVNYIETKQIQPIYDIQEGETTTNETDTQGGSRNIVEKDYSKKVVYEENNNGKSIIVQKEEKPKIAGIIVVANFGNDEKLKEQIVKAVASVSNISEYKVQVLSGN